MTEEGKRLRELRKLTLNSMYHHLKENYYNLLKYNGYEAATRYFLDNKDNIQKCYQAGYEDIILIDNLPYCKYDNGQCNLQCKWFKRGCTFEDFNSR